MAIYKRGPGFELGTTENKSSKWPEPGTAGLRVRRADHSARLPPNLLKSCNGYPTSNGEEYYYEVKHIPSKLKVVQTHGNQPNYGFNDKYSSKDVV